MFFKYKRTQPATHPRPRLALRFKDPRLRAMFSFQASWSAVGACCHGISYSRISLSLACISFLNDSYPRGPPPRGPPPKLPAHSTNWRSDSRSGASRPHNWPPEQLTASRRGRCGLRLCTKVSFQAGSLPVAGHAERGLTWVKPVLNSFQRLFRAGVATGVAWVWPIRADVNEGPPCSASRRVGRPTSGQAPKATPIGRRSGT
jgi:hypothetical protein